MKTLVKLSTQKGRTLSLVLVFAISLLSALTLQSCKKDAVSPFDSEQYTQLHEAMHTLWADHMQYTYATVDAFFNNTDALNSNLTRLLKNQEDIGNGIKPYYGEAAGDSLTSLLKAHINGAVPILTAVKNGTDPTAAINDWYANAKLIGKFLESANPNNWKGTEMEDMMKTHIDQTIKYALDLHSKDYTNAIKDYDVAFAHMTEMMADMLSQGIAKQFPNKF